MVNKRTVDYHPIPSQITYKGTHSHIYMESEGGLYLQNLSWIFPKSVYSTIPFKNLNLLILFHVPQAKLSRKFYHYPIGRRKLPIPPEQRFLKIYCLTSRN